MFKMSIPTISDEELKRRYNQIKPVITIGRKLYYFREFDLIGISFDNYLEDIDRDIGEEVPVDELEVWKGRDFQCLHYYNISWELFTPTIHDVLAQLNVEDIPYIKAFEIIERPKTPSDFWKNDLTSFAFRNGFHVSTVRLYREKNNIVTSYSL